VNASSSGGGHRSLTVCAWMVRLDFYSLLHFLWMDELVPLLHALSPFTNYPFFFFIRSVHQSY